MSAGYVIAKANFKEAVRHVSPETEPVMFNLLCGLQSLTDQIEADFAAMQSAPASKPAGKKPRRQMMQPKKPMKAAAKKARKVLKKKRAKAG